MPVEAKEKHKEKEKHSTKQERSNVIIEVSLSICVKYPPSLTTTFNCVCHPLRGRRRGGGGIGRAEEEEGERYCRSPQVGAESVALSISLRFTGSPYTPKPASCSETRFPERHKDCQSEFKLDFNRHVPRREAQKSIFRTIPAFQFMGIKQPTDLSLQAILGKGADQICMHLRSYTHTHTRTHTGKHRYTHYTHHLRARGSLRGALRPVGVGAIFVGFCGKSVCESV